MGRKNYILMVSGFLVCSYLFCTQEQKGEGVSEKLKKLKQEVEKCSKSKSFDDKIRKEVKESVCDLYVSAEEIVYENEKEKELSLLNIEDLYKELNKSNIKNIKCSEISVKDLIEKGFL